MALFSDRFGPMDYLFSDRFEPANDLLLDPQDPRYAGDTAGSIAQAYQNLAATLRGYGLDPALNSGGVPADANSGSEFVSVPAGQRGNSGAPASLYALKPGAPAPQLPPPVNVASLPIPQPMPPMVQGGNPTAPAQPNQQQQQPQQPVFGGGGGSQQMDPLHEAFLMQFMRPPQMPQPQFFKPQISPQTLQAFAQYKLPSFLG